MEWTDHSLHSLSPCSGGGKEIEPGKERELGRGVFKVYFTFHYLALILLVICSMNIPNLSLFCLWRYLGNKLSVFISTHEPSVLFSLPCPVAEASDWEVFVGVWCPARVNPLLKNTHLTGGYVNGSIVIVTFSVFFLIQNVPLPYYKSHPPVTLSCAKWNVQTPRTWDRGTERFSFSGKLCFVWEESLVNILCSSCLLSLMCFR